MSWIKGIVLDHIARGVDYDTSISIGKTYIKPTRDMPLEMSISTRRAIDKAKTIEELEEVEKKIAEFQHEQRETLNKERNVDEIPRGKQYDDNSLSERKSAIKFFATRLHAQYFRYAEELGVLDNGNHPVMQMINEVCTLNNAIDDCKNMDELENLHQKRVQQELKLKELQEAKTASAKEISSAQRKGKFDDDFALAIRKVALKYSVSKLGIEYFCRAAELGVLDDNPHPLMQIRKGIYALADIIDDCTMVDLDEVHKKLKRYELKLRIVEKKESVLYHQEDIKNSYDLEVATEQSVLREAEAAVSSRYSRYAHELKLSNYYPLGVNSEPETHPVRQAIRELYALSCNINVCKTMEELQALDKRLIQYAVELQEIKEAKTMDTRDFLKAQEGEKMIQEELPMNVRCTRFRERVNSLYAAYVRHADSLGIKYDDDSNPINQAKNEVGDLERSIDKIKTGEELAEANKTLHKLNLKLIEFEGPIR